MKLETLNMTNENGQMELQLTNVGWAQGTTNEMGTRIPSGKGNLGEMCTQHPLGTGCIQSLCPLDVCPIAHSGGVTDSYDVWPPKQTDYSYSH